MAILKLDLKFLCEERVAVLSLTLYFPPLTAQQGHIITALTMSFSEEQMYL